MKLINISFYKLVSRGNITKVVSKYLGYTNCLCGVHPFLLHLSLKVRHNISNIKLQSAVSKSLLGNLLGGVTKPLLKDQLTLLVVKVESNYVHLNLLS